MKRKAGDVQPLTCGNRLRREWCVRTASVPGRTCSPSGHTTYTSLRPRRRYEACMPAA